MVSSEFLMFVPGEAFLDAQAERRLNFDTALWKGDDSDRIGVLVEMKALLKPFDRKLPWLSLYIQQWILVEYA